MAVAFKLKRSSISGRAPDTGSIDYGELAVNTFDGVLYLKKNDGNGDSVVSLKQVTEYNLAIDNTPITNSNSNNLSGILRDLDRAINQNKYQTSSFEIGADDSTIRTVNPGESISFLGGTNITTSSDIEGNITIEGPDLSNYAEDATFTGQVSFNGTGNSVLINDTLRIAETGSGLRMTNVGAFDNNNGDFRVFGSNGLQLLANGSTGSGIEIASNGAIAFNDEYTFPTTDGTNGQVLLTNGNGTLYWATLSGGGGPISLDSLTDVSISSPSTGQVLKYNGTEWTAQDDTAGYSDSDVDTHLNVSGASTNQVLSWDGSDYAWTDQSAESSGYSDDDHIIWNLII